MKKQTIIMTVLILAIAVTGIGLFAWQQQKATANTQATDSAKVTTTATSTPIHKPEEDNQPSASETSQPVEQSVNLYLVAVGDTAAGSEFGCGDSLVGVTKQLTTTTPLADSIRALLAIKDEHYGESGLYSALWQSNITLASASIVGGVANINLTGDLSLGGTCDSPRVEEQLTKTATQFASVSSAVITLNGQPLDQALSTR